MDPLLSLWTAFNLVDKLIPCCHSTLYKTMYETCMKFLMKEAGGPIVLNSVSWEA